LEVWQVTGDSLGSFTCYSGNHGNVFWYGRRVDDAKRFEKYLQEVVRPRVSDSDLGFEADLRALATTGMATEFVERVLRAIPEFEGWEIGEALAECVLRTDSGLDVHWPWNTVRDRRTPRASLPGADLVGFCNYNDMALLVFGEVKTSSDSNTPPKVMNGGSGMAWQLEKNATLLDIQRTLLQWLHARCTSESFQTLYKQAVSRFLASEGKELLIIGVLLRDTTPDENDLQSRGMWLSHRLLAPTRTELFAWYLPVPISDWSKLLHGEAS
jgi:hypothetical protein